MTNLFTGPRHRDRATYTYAGQNREHVFVGKQPASIRGGKLPPWLTGPKSLDFLDSNNPFFHTDRALVSVGAYFGGSIPGGMFTPRPGVTILGDSGGFQILQKPSLWRGDATRQWVLTALEHHTDEAMTLDVPTRGIAPNTPWPSFSAALNITVDNLRFFDRHRIGKTRFLNVLQGETRPDALAWYQAVKWFPAGGWAFGGRLRLDFAHLVDMLIRIARDGMLTPDRNRIHVLGTASLTSAVALSAIQRGLRERLGDPDLHITFDAATPSINSKNAIAYGLPHLSRNAFKLTSFGAPTQVRPERAQVPFPGAHTSVGSRLVMGELCVAKRGSLARTAWDDLSLVLICHHNVEALYSAIDTANSILELHPDDAVDLAPAWVINAYHALYYACLSNAPLSYLRPSLADIVRL